MRILHVISPTADSNWKPVEKLALRFFVIYFVLLTVPLDWKFYRDLFDAEEGAAGFFQLFKVSQYAPRFFSLTGYANWLVAAALAAIGVAIWKKVEKSSPDFEVLHYWLRVILRYRLAIGIIAYGFIKLFPLQMPYPSLSNLHTNYGDFFAWKIYFHTLGIAPGYEVFLGAIEVFAGILLLFRRTVTFGSGIIVGFTGNVWVANIAYDAGEQVYSGYLVVIALFLVVYDVPRLYRLLVRGQQTVANKFKPIFAQNPIKTWRIVLKTAFSLVVIILGASTYANYVNDPYKIPSTPGLPGTHGFYHVREFKFNNEVIPYSLTDLNRWQNVVFEKWATISIKIAKPIILDQSNGDGFHREDIFRNYESAGVGGRHYYTYVADTALRTLVLENKNPNHKGEHFSLSYEWVGDSTIIVSGVNERQDSIYAVLDRIDRNYMLYEGRRKPVKL